MLFRLPFFIFILLLSGCSQPPAEVKYNVFEAAGFDAPKYSAKKNNIVKSKHISPTINNRLPVKKQAASDVIKVKSGDTLYSIARNYGLSRNSIIEANNLRYPYTLMVGQKLKLSNVEGLENYKTHKVKQGETVYSIARRYGSTKNKIVSINNIRQPYILMAGQNLKVPNTVGNKKNNIQPIKTAQSSVPKKIKPPKKTKQKQSISKIEKPKFNVSKKSRKGFQWPVKGKIISSFGSKSGGVKNDGINILAKSGTSVTTAAKGKIVFIGDQLKGYGNLVIIRHSKGVLTAYAHLNKVVVGKNQTVKTGQIIGYVGKTGSADKPQLHFAVRKGRKPVDPRTYLP